MGNKNNHAVSGFMIGLSHMTDRKKRPGKEPFSSIRDALLCFKQRSAPLGTYLMYSTASVAAI